MNEGLIFVSSILALMPAILWFVACFIRISYRQPARSNEWEDVVLEEDGAEFISTVKRQAAWNAADAVAAGLAALCQVALTRFP